MKRLKIEDLKVTWEIDFNILREVFLLKGQDRQEKLEELNLFTLAIIEPIDDKVPVDVWLGSYPYDYGPNESYILYLTSDIFYLENGENRQDCNSFDNQDGVGIRFIDDKIQFEEKLKIKSLKMMNKLIKENLK
jgi:hypothetical protein